MTRYARHAMAALLVTGVVLVLHGAPAAAAGRLTLSTASSRVDARTAILFDVSATGISRLDAVVVERQFGSTHEWRPVARVRAGGNLQVSTSALSMGRYVYRALAMAGNRVVARSSLVTVFAYGTVSLTQLARRSQETQVAGWGTGTIQVGGSPFTWHSNTTGNDGPGQNPSITAQNSSCRSIDVQFAVSDTEVEHGGVAQVGAGLTQTSSIVQNSNGSAGQVNAASFSISSATWSLSLWASYGDEVYYAATLSCWSATGDA